MLELEFLGTHSDGTHITLNDAEGNRYSLPVTDELRAALRRDRVSTTGNGEDHRPMSPKDIQAYFRSGMSLDELSELSAMSPSQLSPFEHPIRAEQAWAANQARSFLISRELGSLTLEELVASRLNSRGVVPSAIAWDAIRRPGESWELSARYVAGDRERTATWSIAMDTRTVHALNDEARWLSENEISPKDTPWRSPRRREESVPSPAQAHSELAEQPEETPSVPNPQASRSTIVSMLDGLQSRRGKKQPMPTVDDDEFLDDPPPAHPAQSAPEDAPDATILTLPQRGAFQASEAEESTNKSAEEPTNEVPEDSAPEESEVAEENSSSDDDGLFKAPKPEGKPAPKKRGARASIPSWDEIVFGQPKD